MPIYEYLCSECAHTLDALQKLSDDPLVYCPQCGAAALKRQMSAPSFRLKGGGWYETDFKSDKRKNIAEADSKPADTSADKPADKPTEKPADSKPADKAADTKAAKSDKPAATESKKSDAPAAATKKPEAGKAGGVA